MITFYFIRHGAKEAVPYDPPLSKNGVEQAQTTAKLLSEIDFKVAVSSPKLRTRQTAEILAKPHAIPVLTDDRLIERLEWENEETFEAFMTEWNKTALDRNFIPRIGMSSHNNGRRMHAVLFELTKQHKEGNILIVSHGGTIEDVLLDLFSEKEISYVHDPTSGIKYINIAECSVTAVRFDQGRYTLLKCGDAAHLTTPSS